MEERKHGKHLGFGWQDCNVHLPYTTYSQTSYCWGESPARGSIVLLAAEHVFNRSSFGPYGSIKTEKTL